MQPKANRPSRLRRALPCALLTLLAPLLAAQREYGGSPPSAVPDLARGLAPGVATVLLPPVDVRALQEEDRLAPPGGPLRFAFTHRVDLDAGEDGTWQTLADGSRLWRLRVRSPGALSLSLLFSRFRVPAGGELFVYDDAREHVHGAYTARNVKPDGRFAVQPVPGDAVTIEYWQPAGTTGAPELTLGEVYHDYRGFTAILASQSGFNGLASGPCEKDVACPIAQPWADEVDAVCQIQNGATACSGALINNTAGDGRQLLLTAEHCGKLDNAIFYFNYEEATCGGTGATRTDSVQGSTLLASDVALDFRLVELDEQIPESYGAKYLGWDRSDVPPATGTLVIHHPQGDAKKISFDIDPPTYNGTFWNIGRWDLGTTEPGSSGSPLMDAQGHFVGQLSFGTADCVDPSNDNFGRLATEWSLVAPFLDPTGSGVMQLGLFDPNSGSSDPLAITAVDPASIPALLPGTDQAVTLTGTGFQDGMVLKVGGVALPTTSFTRRTSSIVTVDMPQVGALGPVDLTLEKGLETATITPDLVPPSPIAYQAGTGDPGNQVGSIGGVDLIVSGNPGDLHLVVYSLSDLPSSHPLWMLSLGNNFTDVNAVGCYVVGSPGWTQVNIPISGIALTTIYSQATDISGGAPFEVSNLQEVFVVF